MLFKWGDSFTWTEYIYSLFYDSAANCGAYFSMFRAVFSFCSRGHSGSGFSYKLRYIVGFWLVEMTISTNQKRTIYRNLYENTAPVFRKKSTKQDISLVSAQCWAIVGRWRNIEPILGYCLACAAAKGEKAMRFLWAWIHSYIHDNAAIYTCSLLPTIGVLCHSTQYYTEAMTSSWITMPYLRLVFMYFYALRFQFTLHFMKCADLYAIYLCFWKHDVICYRWLSTNMP